MERLKAEEAAKALIEGRFPNCRAAILGGSVIRGEGTAQSDLDIVVIDCVASAYRESFHAFQWPVELFVHNATSYRVFFERDCQRGRPSLPNMCVEGIILKDDGIALQIKQEARNLLDKGPETWGDEEIRARRYGISDALDDLESSKNHAEDLFTANTLAFSLHEFVLRTHDCWIGGGKWIVRALKRYDQAFCKQFVDTFDHFYQTGEKDELIAFADGILEPYGGRLFDGFSVGKQGGKPC